jgi:Chalcone isomerase-like
MKKLLALGAVFVLVSCALLALDVAGVKVPDTVTVEGKALKLNGAGVRKKMIVKVYVASLYLETPSKDATAIVASNQIKSMRLHMLRDVEGPKISGAIAEGFERNSKAALPQLKARLDQLAKMIPDVKEGDELCLSWIPDSGTHVLVRGTAVGTIEGRDFADALFSVWLGPDPVQEDLKLALLGG